MNTAAPDANFSITTAADGYIHFEGRGPYRAFTMLVEDDLASVEDCDLVLEAVSAVRSGTRPDWRYGWNATWLTLTPAGATLHWAMKVPDRLIAEVSLDQVEAVVRALRAVLAARPGDE